MKARNTAIHEDIDLLVSVGGGSTIGLAKAIALTTALPIIAVPTTYAGSEATNVWGLTESSRKTTGIDDSVLPVTVIYDADLTLSLPRDLSIASGLNAVAHCIDSMWAPRTDPISQALAAEGIRALNNGLPAISSIPKDLTGRELVLYGAYLSAVAFASAGSGMHHKICHVLGGRWNMPHAQTHAVVLPYVLGSNAPDAADAAHRIAAAFRTENALKGLNPLRDTLGAPRALKDLGLAKENVKEAVQLILPVIPASNPAPSPRKREVDEIETTGHTYVKGGPMTGPRSADKGRTKQRIADAALDLFQRKGYNGTSVQDLVDAAGAPKGTFYNHFASKEDLAAETVLRYGDRWNLAALADSAAGSPRARIERHLAGLIASGGEAAAERGCLMANLAGEVPAHSPMLAGVIGEHLREWVETLTSVIDEAKLAGEITSGADAADLAEFIVNAWEGGAVKAKVTASGRPVEVFERMVSILLR